MREVLFLIFYLVNDLYKLELGVVYLGRFYGKLFNFLFRCFSRKGSFKVFLLIRILIK